MAVLWQNGGEKTGDGEYIVELDLEDGSQPQRFRARTRKEMNEKLAEAQFSATRTIQTLKSERTPERPPVETRITPIQLTADERMRLAVDLQDPSKADGAVKRLIESSVGPLGEIVRRENERIEREEETRSVAETHKFVARNPDWYPTAANKAGVFNYIEGNQLAITAVNMEIAWDDLKSSGKAELKPESTEGEENAENAGAPQGAGPAAPNGNGDGTRPRLASFSTGLRAGDTSRTATVTTRPKYTKADILKLSSTEYERRLKEEPGFMAAVDALGPVR